MIRKESSQRQHPAAQTAAGRTTTISITASALLASLCTFYWYGFFRATVLFPSPLQYLGLVAITLGIFSGPPLMLLAGAQIVLNRGVRVRRHLVILALTGALGVFLCEGLILANDLSVTRPSAPISGWQHRWFPFSFQKVGYNKETGQYYAY